MLLFKKILLLSLISVNSCYFLNHKIIHNTIISSNYKISNIKNKSNQIYMTQNTDFDIVDKILHTKFVNNKLLGRIIVEQISNILPNVDSIGHNVLKANNEFITNILDTNIPIHIQKIIILLSIKLAQYGDNAGSYFLQLYYDLVDKCL